MAVPIEAIPRVRNAGSRPSLLVERFAAHINLVTVAGIGVIALALRLIGLGAESLWGDEIASVLVVRGEWADLVTKSLSSSAQPLYFLVAKAVTSVAGESEFAMRLPSALFGAGTIVPVYLLARRLSGQPTALIAAFLVGVSAALIWPAQDARPYAMATFFVVLSTYLMVRYLDEQSDRALMAYTAAAFLGLYTHYYFALVLAGQAAVAIPMLLRRSPSRRLGNIAKWISAGAVVSLAILSRAEAAAHDFTQSDAAASAPLMNVLRDIVVAVGFGDPDLGAPVVVIATTWVFTLAGIVVVLLRRDRTTILIPVAIAPVLLLGFGSVLFDLPILLRHLYGVIPLLLILAAYGVAMLISLGLAARRTWARAVTCALAAAVISGLVASSLVIGHEQLTTTFKQQWREAAAYVDSMALNSDVVYFKDPTRANMYRHLNFYLERPEIMRVAVEDDQQITCHEGRRTWVITRGSTPRVPRIQRAGGPCDLVASLQFARIGVYLFSAAPISAAPLDPDCEGLQPTILGTQESDFILGTAGNDVIHGLGGDDTIAGLGGADIICGGPGNDVLRGDNRDVGGVLGSEATLWPPDPGDDLLDGGEGRDMLYGGGGNDTLTGGAGDDRLYGRVGNDRLIGGDGNDVAEGGDNDDSVDGGSGNDRLFGRAGADGLDGGPGDDLLDGGDAEDALQGGDGSDVLLGREGDDRLAGGEGRDALEGRVGDDVLDGGPGDDTLDGGKGSNRCDGGPGSNRLVNCTT